MNKPYQYKDLNSKYQLISEAHLQLTREMFREECWDAAANGPIPECWSEFGTVKDECWAQQPGTTTSAPGYAGTAGGDSLGEVSQPVNNSAALLEHLTKAEECAGTWMTEANDPGHPMHHHATNIKSILKDLKEYVQECSY